MGGHVWQAIGNMRILNLYAGLGGNRKLWKGYEVTAVELNPDIAKFYADQFPEDKVLVEDAHEFLLKHFQEFDFIWSSIECPTHSRSRFWASSKGKRYDPVYPDMKLYEEILFLKHYYEGKWTVENVKPYYNPLVMPSIVIERHMFWTNFPVSKMQAKKNTVVEGKIISWQEELGFNLAGYDFKGMRKDKILRNCVDPEIGLHLLNCAINKTNKILF